MKTLLFLVAFVAANILVQRAHAQDAGSQPADEVERLNEEAKTEFRQAQRQFASALAKFDKALILAPGDSRLHFNRARVLERLGRTVDAQDALRRYLAVIGPTAEDRDKVAADVARLDTELMGEAKPPTPAVPMSLMGRLEIRVRVDPEAKPPLVAINGDRIETLGGKPNEPLSLPPGSYYVLVHNETGQTDGMVEVKKGELTPFVVPDPPAPRPLGDTLAQFPPLKS